MNYFVKNDSTAIHSPGGFWGHLGILVQGQPKYLWFPITAYTRQLVYKNSTEKYMAIPCMDNSLLLINCNKIEELVLLDEACGSPVDMDWDSTVSEGEIPAVVYRTNGRRLQGAVTHKAPPASCHGNRGRCGFMGNASGAAKPQCSRELTHARAAVLAWSLLYIFRVVLYTFWLMALLALVAAACLASSVSAAATAAFISA